MIRTIEFRGWQLRWDWTGVAYLSTQRPWWALQVFWWKRPRIVWGPDRKRQSFPHYKTYR